MKHLLTITLLTVFYTNIFSQKTEYNFHLNSGLLYFSGISIESTGQISYNIDREEGYTTNPYGDKSGLSYGFSTNLSRISKKRFKFALELGYETIASKIDITTVWIHGDGINEAEEAEGKTNFIFNNLNLFTSLGYRILISDFKIDIDAGLELAYILKATEKGYAKSNTREYETYRSIRNIRNDLRARVQMKASKNRIGAYVGYSKGIINYKKGYLCGINNAYSNIIRFGLIYSLNNNKVK